jgi:hypothetical protein
MPVSPTVTRFAALATLALGGLACGHPAALDVPFRLETGSPPRPPAATLVVTSGSNEARLRGTRYTADWTTNPAVVRTAPPIPVPWPDATPTGGSTQANLEFATTFLPDIVVVHAYASVADAGREPEGAPFATHECSGVAEPKCEFSRTPTAVRVHLPGTDILAGRYITVFAIWHVPLVQREASHASPTVSASWLFRADREHILGVSTP